MVLFVKPQIGSSSEQRPVLFHTIYKMPRTLIELYKCFIITTRQTQEACNRQAKPRMPLQVMLCRYGFKGSRQSAQTGVADTKSKTCNSIKAMPTCQIKRVLRIQSVYQLFKPLQDLGDSRQTLQWALQSISPSKTFINLLLLSFSQLAGLLHLTLSSAALLYLR